MKMGFALRLGLVFILLLACMPQVGPVHAQTTGTGWHLVGQIGGETKAVMVYGQTLYLGVGQGVEIFDISKPGDPKMIGSSPVLPNPVEGLFVNGSKYLYTACGTGGLQILDVSDPAAPSLVGVYDTRGYTEGVFVVGDYAVLADGPDGIQVLDISNPQQPVKVGEAYPLAYAYDVKVTGTTVYAAAGGSGLLVVDLTYPAHPQEKGLVNTGGFLYNLAIEGDKLFTAGAWGGVTVLDISNPIAPVVSSTVDVNGWALAVSVQESRLLVMAGLDGAQMYDLSAGTPTLVQTYKDVGLAQQGTLQGSNAFVTDKEKGLLVVNFPYNYSPQLLSSYTPILDARRVTLSGTTAYVAAGMSGMHTVDLSNPAQPRETFWYDTKSGYANKVLVEGTVAYLTSHITPPEPLVIFDVSDPLHPKKLGTTGAGPEYFFIAFRSMAYSNGYLFIPGEGHDASVDVRDPANPKLASSIEMENPVDAAVSGNLLITVNSNELQLVDITDPTSIKLITKFERSSSGEGLAFLDNHTLVVGGDAGILLVDVSNPAAPFKRSGLGLPGTVFSVFIDGATAYVSSLGGGVHIVDLSNPDQPRLIETIATPGLAYDSSVQGNTMVVADAYGGLLIYQRDQAGIPGQGGKVLAALRQIVPQTVPSFITPSSFPPEENDAPASGTAENVGPALQGSQSCVVTAAADDGEGSFRSCLKNLSEGTAITFDTTMFPPRQPATIQLISPLPEINAKHIVIDASNAGVILDGSKLSSGIGLSIRSSFNKVMGLQILHFPEDGIRLEGESNQVGGNRQTGAGPTGQGNVISGNARNGIIIYGKNNVFIGNLVGTDVTGTQAVPNEWGVFISEWGVDIIIGSTQPGEGNLISGNNFINIDSWGLRTRIIGNWIGLDITGERAIKPDSSSNLMLEAGVADNVVGGTTPEERNVISGAQLGVVFSDVISYQNSVIGNYIGTNASGTRAVPNQTGVLIWTVNHNRVGGTAPGEGNLISGNQTGIDISGIGDNNNIVLGNTLGLDANGNPTLPNNTAFSLYAGTRHSVIGGFTSAEANHIYGSEIGLRITEGATKYNYIAGNDILNITGMGIYFENHSSDNFVQANTFSGNSSFAVRVDYGSGNQVRANEFDLNPANAIMLLENGNMNLAAPVIQSAASMAVSGTACADCFVEVYGVLDGKVQFAGETAAGTDGNFQFQSCAPIPGNQVVALAIDPQGNTSPFSIPSPLAAAAGTPDRCNVTPEPGNALSTATPWAAAISTPAAAGTSLPNTPAGNPTAQPTQQPSNPAGKSALPVVIGVIIGIVVVGVVAVVLVRRKK